jgi:hypothetical protein
MGARDGNNIRVQITTRALAWGKGNRYCHPDCPGLMDDLHYVCRWFRRPKDTGLWVNLYGRSVHARPPSCLMAEERK